MTSLKFSAQNIEKVNEWFDKTRLDVSHDLSNTDQDKVPPVDEEDLREEAGFHEFYKMQIKTIVEVERAAEKGSRKARPVKDL